MKGSGIGPSSPAQNEPPIREFGQGVLKGGEVAPGERVDGAPGGSGGTYPSPQHRRAGALLGLGQEVEEDWQLRPVLELAREQRQRVDVQQRAQLVLGEAEQIEQASGAL